MKVLTQNYTDIATLSATNIDANYPLANLKHPFMKKIWKGTTSSESVTIDFGYARSVNSVYIGLTNANVLSVTLYNEYDSVLYTTGINATSKRATFATVVGVRYAIVYFTATDVVYCGNIGVGFAHTMPDPLNDVLKGYKDNSRRVETDDGQVMIHKSAWLRTIEPSFYVESRDDYNMWYGLFADIERPIWVDPFENTVDAINPIYGVVEFVPDSKDDRIYNFHLNITEAR